MRHGTSAWKGVVCTGTARAWQGETVPGPSALCPLPCFLVSRGDREAAGKTPYRARKATANRSSSPEPRAFGTPVPRECPPRVQAVRPLESHPTSWSSFLFADLGARGLEKVKREVTRNQDRLGSHHQPRRAVSCTLCPPEALAGQCSAALCSARHRPAGKPTHQPPGPGSPARRPVTPSEL